MSKIKYIIGTKNKEWFFMYHSVDCGLVTKNIGQAVGVYEEDKDELSIDYMFAENSIKFIDFNGPEINKPYGEIIGIDIKIEDCCIFKLETKIEYLLEQV